MALHSTTQSSFAISSQERFSPERFRLMFLWEGNVAAEPILFHLQFQEALGNLIGGRCVYAVHLLLSVQGDVYAR